MHHFSADKVRINWKIETDINLKFFTPPGNNKFYVSPTSGNLYFSNLERDNADLYTCEVRSKWADANGDFIIKSSRQSTRLSVTGEGENNFILIASVLQYFRKRRAKMMLALESNCQLTICPCIRWR